MKTEDRYLKFVRWSEADGFYVGYCPDLFLGAACAMVRTRGRRISSWVNWCAKK